MYDEASLIIETCLPNRCCLVNEAKDIAEKYFDIFRRPLISEIDESHLQYKEICYRFRHTLGAPNQIVKIEEIYNPKLLSKFKGKEIGNVQLLFHGTKMKANKDKIIKNGFDITKANKGLHGWGLYFADDAVYSDNYTCPEG